MPADDAGNDAAGMDADTHLERHPPAPHHGGEAIQHLQGHLRHRLGVIGPRLGHASHRHIGIADRLDLLHAMVGGDMVERSEDLVEHLHEVWWIDVLRVFREAAQIGKQNRRGRKAVGDSRLAVFEPLGDLWGEDIEEQLFRFFLFVLEIGQRCFQSRKGGVALHESQVSLGVHADTGDELDRIGKLDEIVVGSSLEKVRLDHRLLAGREDDDRHIAGRREGSEPAHHLEPVEAWHDEVLQNERRPEGHGQFDRFLRVRREGVNDVALVGEHLAHRLADQLLIVEQENAMFQAGDRLGRRAGRVGPGGWGDVRFHRHGDSLAKGNGGGQGAAHCSSLG